MRSTALPLCVLAALLLSGCPEPDARPGESRLVVPEVPGAIAASAGGLASQNGTLPRIIATLDRADRLVTVVNANLDADPQEEQVVAVQRRDDPAAPVRLLVLDPEFPRGRGARISWEAPTLAASARAFSLSVKDLVGDHGMQLVATGTSSEGRFTLDVFRRAAADDLVFAPICRIVADEIEIEETPRTEAYSSGLKNGASWPVISWLRDTESDNPMDLVRIRWSWRPAMNRYASEPPEKVPGEQVGQEQLRQLYADLRPAAFESFIAGLWGETPAPARRPSIIVQFDVASRRIAINDGDTLESFAWRDTVRTLFDRIVVVAENEAVSRIRRTFSIRASGASTIAVSIRGDSEWDARDLDLARLPERPAGAAGAAAAAISPVGEYAGLDGGSVRFDGDGLAWTVGAVNRRGTWVSFVLGSRSILTVRFLDGSREARSWLAGLKETRDKTSVTRKLTLSPVLLTAEGWEETAGQALELTQTEKLAKP
ncbi:MAG: pallilysin-related adhesin [Spirochaetes bacterium]|nr:pallilysin-related adhesin [Spirochaetota bacterium]